MCTVKWKEVGATATTTGQPSADMKRAGGELPGMSIPACSALPRRLETRGPIHALAGALSVEVVPAVAHAGTLHLLTLIRLLSDMRTVRCICMRWPLFP